MTGYGFKGGIGTSSRIFGNFTVGVLVQLNCGVKQDLSIAGIPAGREITLPVKPAPSPGNSIIVVVATDLDLTHRQLWKVAKRATHGIARTGSIGGDTSGDYAVAFTTGTRKTGELLEMYPQFIRPGSAERYLNAVYRCTVEATEEAILNALFKAETMIGYQGHTRHALPLDQLKDIMERYGRHF
jgi:D-aminopeptidase